MSNRIITKKVEATVCDFCDKEIDTKADNYCYSHIEAREGVVHDPIHRKKFNIVHYILSFPRIIKGSGWLKGKREDDKEWKRYDFHAECFDDIMIKFLSEKNNE